MEKWTLQGQILLQVFSHTLSTGFSPLDFFFNYTFSHRKAQTRDLHAVHTQEGNNEEAQASVENTDMTL